MNRTKIAILWITLLFCFLAGWVISEKRRFAPGAGASILVKTIPVDPRDLLRGQYLRLRYPFGVAKGRFTRKTVGKAPIWVTLRARKRNLGERDQRVFHEPVFFSDTKPDSVKSNDVVIQGFITDGRRIEFGIEKYFVSEGTPTPAQESVTVRLRIDQIHRPRIEQVYVNNKPWP
jgi:uncharacterized membrane-anchored protein